MHIVLAIILIGLGSNQGWLLSAQAEGQEPFYIRVVDEETGRGIPLVELETVNNVLYVTDSAGLSAIREPGLMGKQIYFHVRSHGYEFPEDGFGYRGIRAVLVPGDSIRIEMRRLNVAERLYRVTGQGIYRDSAIRGDPVPIVEPLLNGGVFGQDSVVNAIYRGQLYWFWGDTNRASYPLGNFAVAGAVSKLPAEGGLNPSLGVDLIYFLDEEGFARKMCPIEGPGPVWIWGLMVMEHEGQEQLLCYYERMESLAVRLEQGIVIWNDEREIFEKIREFPLDAPLHPLGHPIRIQADGEEWFYFPDPYPSIRVRARMEEILDSSRYQAYTCFREGSRWSEEDPPLERDESGALLWEWKADTPDVPFQRWRTLVEKGLVSPDERWPKLIDVETGEQVLGHRGSICWNDYRKKWIMITVQAGGRSYLGEVWYAESDELLGPWSMARRIVTHDRYSFYNVKQHPCFDQENGRLVYFEGTYTSSFSGNDKKTPRYDYNQIMYRLDLDDPRLELRDLERDTRHSIQSFFPFPPRIITGD